MFFGILTVVLPNNRAHVSEAKSFLETFWNCSSFLLGCKPNFPERLQNTGLNRSSKILLNEENIQIFKSRTGTTCVVVCKVSMSSSCFVWFGCLVGSHVVKAIFHACSRVEISFWVLDNSITLLILSNINSIWISLIWINIPIIPLELVHHVIKVAASTILKNRQEVGVLWVGAVSNTDQGC